MKKALTTTFASLLTLISVAAIPAFALEKGGVDIRGNVNQQVTARDVTATASGRNAKAGLSMATVHGGSQIRGNVTQKVAVRNVTSTASGRDAKSCLQLATVGDNPACK